MRVLLVTMPFGKIDRPSLPLGLLKAALARDGVDCDVAYLNLAFAGRLGTRLYDRITVSRQKALAGDWVFAGCLYEEGSPHGDRYVHQVLEAQWRFDEGDIEAILAARDLAPRYLESVLTDLRWPHYDLVGFTCNFGQTVPSLALARLAKQRYPHLLTVLGGPTWHGIMGRTLFASFPFVDAACPGEGDTAFPSLVRALAEGGRDTLGSIPGMLVRGSDGATHDGGDDLVDDLDGLPIPDYDDFATTLAGLGVSPDGAVVVPVETSRGCSWGVRRPCRFCGIVGPHRTYRTKSAGRILRELRALAAHPGCRVVDVVDNVASPALLNTVLPRLAQDPLPAHLDVDIRPDVGRRTVELMARTGTDALTGIESLSERVLTLMNKGTHALESARLLKWSKALGVRMHWNLLYGVPGETAADYDDLLGILRAIAHLDAPLACATVDVERFSSYFEDPEAYGFANVRPASAYSFLFPFGDDVLGDIAYFFDHGFAPGLEPPGEVFQLRHLVYNWQRAPATRDLRVRHGGAVVVDTRRPEDENVYRLDELERAVYLACDDIRTRAGLEEDMRRSGIECEGLTERIDEALGWFVERGLMLQRDDRYLSLALPESAPPAGTPATAASETEQVQLQGV